MNLYKNKQLQIKLYDSEIIPPEKCVLKSFHQFCERVKYRDKEL